MRCVALVSVLLITSPLSAQTLDVTPFWAPIDLSAAVDLGHPPRGLDGDDARPAGAIAFVDASEQAGLAGARAGGNTHGVGVGFVDVDGDTFPDIVVANGQSNAGLGAFPSLLYRNRGDGTFVDATAASGLAPALDGRDTYSVAAGDYDDDGDVDLYFGAHPHDILLRNDGGGRFFDATVEAGAGGPASAQALASDGRSKIAAFGDFDGDGRLDIVSASSTLLGSDRAYVLRNIGGGRFVDVTLDTAIDAHGVGNPCAVMWSDIDNDGDQDLWIWNDRGGHVLLRNDAGRFVDITAATDASIRNPMGIDGADLDGNGFLDYYISNAGDHPLLRNNANGTFTDVTVPAGTRGDFGWGLAFEDFNLDGRPDLFVAQEDDRPYLVYTRRDSDAIGFDVMALAHTPVRNTNAAHNVAAAFADYDRDGRVDAVLGTTDGTRVMLFRNVTDVGTHRYLEVAVDRAPNSPQRGGVTARVAIQVGGVVQFRDITGGSSRASQNALSVRFGIGSWTGVDWVAVLWPDGRQYVATNVPGNQTVRFPLTATNEAP